MEQVREIFHNGEKNYIFYKVNTIAADDLVM